MPWLMIVKEKVYLEIFSLINVYILKSQLWKAPLQNPEKDMRNIDYLILKSYFKIWLYFIFNWRIKSNRNEAVF